jgi:polar amino acid transport system permease protein
VDQFLETFFSWEHFRESIPRVVEGFRTNLALMFLAEACVLAWGLVLALMRLGRGRATAPLRWLSITYIDLFRAVPGLVLIYMIGFGIPISGVPFFSDWSQFQLAVLALTVLYGAYVAEVYRAGIDSVHPSQEAAARSLGLSRLQALRHVVLPQAIRRVIPPLLNDFIGLQKDTALVALLGVVEAFRQSQIEVAGSFNYTPYVATALIFLALTIPLTRFTDWLIARERRRRR